MYPGLSQVLTKSFSHQIHLAKHVDDCRLSYVAQATRDMKEGWPNSGNLVMGPQSAAKLVTAEEEAEALRLQEEYIGVYKYI